MEPAVLEDVCGGSRNVILSKSARNKQLKKEKKLILNFIKKVLKEYGDNLGMPDGPEPYLLVDNRDYQVKLSTKELFETFAEIVDIVVPPCKTWMLFQFDNLEDAQAFVQKADLKNQTGINQFAFINEDIYDSASCAFTYDEDDILMSFDSETHPESMKSFQGVIDEAEEKNLIEYITKVFAECEGTSKLCKLKNRSAVHYGHVFDYNQNTISPSSRIEVVQADFPPEILYVVEKLKNILPESPDQLTINRYSGVDGHHIPPHVDTHSMCTNWILSLSLGSDIVMNLSNPREPHRLYSTILLRREALLLQDEARYLFRHSIPQTTQDRIPVMTKRMDNIRLGLMPRGLRFSLTFRKITPSGYKCKCAYPEMCDSQRPNKKSVAERQLKDIDNPDRAKRIETEYVHQIYDDIASHFSSTRYGCWPKVVEFLKSLSPHSLVLDVGCGNGKYLGSGNPELCMIGSDRSANLLQICRERSFEIFQDDCIAISRTVRPGLFDAVICIAVVHHLATEERRLEAIQSIVKLLTVGGQALVTVWAFEQKRGNVESKYLSRKTTSSQEYSKPLSSKAELPVHVNRTDFQKQDLFVPWTKNKTCDPKAGFNTEASDDVKLRFYHVFREAELENLILKCENVEIVDTYYDQGNWCAIFKKID